MIIYMYILSHFLRNVKKNYKKTSRRGVRSFMFNNQSLFLITRAVPRIARIATPPATKEPQPDLAGSVSEGASVATGASVAVGASVSGATVVSGAFVVLGAGVVADSVVSGTVVSGLVVS